MKKFELKTIQTDFPAVKIMSAKDSEQVIRQFYGDDIEIFESLFILLLNNANITVGYAKISQGGITGTVVDVRLICKYAIDSLATGVIMAHNHPSGTLTASDADRIISVKVRNALELFDIRLLDSLILTKESSSVIDYK
jgi:DNA repair protein RadC